MINDDVKQEDNMAEPSDIQREDIIKPNPQEVKDVHEMADTPTAADQQDVDDDVAKALKRLQGAMAQHAQVQQDIKEIEVSIALSKLAWRPHLDCLRSQEKSMKEQQGIE